MGPDILDVELQWLLFSDVTQIYLMVAAGDVAHKTRTVKFRADLQSDSKTIWSPNLSLGHLDSSTIVALKLYSSRKFLFRRLLGSAQMPVADIFDPNQKDEPLLLLGRTSPPLPTVSLKIVHSSDPQEVEESLVNTVSKPKVPLNKYGKLIDGVITVKEIIDIVTEVNPAAKMAWVVISMGVDILSRQKDADELIVELYETMLTAHTRTSGEEFLKRFVEFHQIYDSLLEQTIVCAKFIEVYARKGIIGRILNGKSAEEARKIQQGFREIDKQLLLSVGKENYKLTSAQTTATQIKETQDSLKPPYELKPKSMCLDGTRDQILNEMMNWIQQCKGSTLWCTGMAGTGKSSLMGTLRGRLVGRNQLGCYIRYDRKIYTDLSQLITTIAYSLCKVDNRIAIAISEAVRNSPGVLSSPSDDQFRDLLQKPLFSAHGLDKARPVVIIVDGVDECDVSEQMDVVLQVLAKGFGPDLPFMRIIVSSRPIERITRVLDAPSNILLNISLDDVSDQVVRDIQLYIQHRFASIYRDRKLRDGHDEFRNVCESLQAVETLSQRAKGLFIWAATVCDFLAQFPVKSRLQRLLEAEAPKSALDALTSLYRTALHAIVSETPQDMDIKGSVRAVLGALIVATDEITVQTIRELVFPHDNSEANVTLAKLGSVVHTSPQGHIQLIHQSFYDFLKDRDQCEEWYVDEEEQRRQLLHSIGKLPLERRTNYLPLHKALIGKVL